MDSCPFAPCIATMSLGSPRHCLAKKLRLASRAGFQGIELYWDDLVAYASDNFGPPSALSPTVPPTVPPALSSPCCARPIEAAARHISSLCASLGLTVVCLQPFRNYDGIIDADEHAARLHEFRFWMGIATILHTDTIGVPATIDPRGRDINNRAAVVADMRELAELAATRGMRIAYENLCFSAAVSTWQDAWDVVRAVDLPNLGFLPDTFNICGSAFADPGHDSGIIPGIEPEFRKSMARLRADVDATKVFLIQVADGERLAEPIGPEHAWMAAPGVLNPRMAWSRNARLFPLEDGSYLPILDVLRALVGETCRFQGAAAAPRWISIEVFSRSTAEPGEEVVEKHVHRAWGSWLKIRREMGWQGRVPRSVSMPALAKHAVVFSQPSPAKVVA